MFTTQTIVLIILQFIITAGTGLGTLLSQEGVSGLADISQAAIVSLLVGAAVAAANTLYAKLQPKPTDETPG